MIGTSATTGKPLDGLAHLKQSLRDILTTPIGSRVMRRGYGSRLFQLIDAPLNAQTITDIYAATAEAIQNWEPRFRIKKVSMANAETGVISLLLEGDYLPEGIAIKIDGIVVK